VEQPKNVVEEANAFMILPLQANHRWSKSKTLRDELWDLSKIKYRQSNESSKAAKTGAQDL